MPSSEMKVALRELEEVSGTKSSTPKDLSVLFLLA
jgi:hypothetical protein